MGFFDLPDVFGGSAKKAAKKKATKKAPGKKKAAKKKAVRKKAPAKKVAKRRHTKKKISRAKRKQTRKKIALARGLLEHVRPIWGKIQAAAARSLGKKPHGFLPDLDEKQVLGCGFWGCVFPTADPRFVLKISLDATEGPHVALAMKHFQLDPGVAYFHRIWRMRNKVWTDEYGYTDVWIILREEVDVATMWSGEKPAKKYAKVHNVLQKLPECCSCLVRAKIHVQLGDCDVERLRAEEKVLKGLLGQIKTGPARYVSRLLNRAYVDHRIVLGDVHYDNVGKRHHDLKSFGVPFHHDLVVSDLGDWGQNPITWDKYPKIKVVENPMRLSALAEGIPVL